MCCFCFLCCLCCFCRADRSHPFPLLTFQNVKNNPLPPPSPLTFEKVSDQSLVSSGVPKRLWSPSTSHNLDFQHRDPERIWMQRLWKEGPWRSFTPSVPIRRPHQKALVEDFEVVGASSSCNRPARRASPPCNDPSSLRNFWLHLLW